MKKMMKAATIFFVGVFGLTILSYAGQKEPDVLRVEIGEDVYEIPKIYKASGGYHQPTEQNDLFVQFEKTNMGPLSKNVPGWKNNVNLLLSDFAFPVAQLYDNLWDGELHPQIESSKIYEIVKTTRINDNLLYQEMGGFTDIVLVTDDEGNFDGFMMCDKYEMKGAANACQFLFNEEGKRWKISFGKQFIEDYKQIRRDVMKQMDSFKLNTDNSEGTR